MSALPLDVLTKIIDELDPHNAADAMALRSLSLSCHAVLRFAQMALFAEIGLQVHSHNPQSSLTQVMRLKDVVRLSSPHIARYIRSFKVGLAVHEVRDLKRIEPALEVLETTLPSLGNLQEFGLRYTLWKDSNWQTQCLDWLSLSPGFCRAVEAVVNSPDLVRFGLGRIKNFPLSILMDHTPLIDLDVEQPYIVDIKVIPSSKSGATTFKDGDVSRSRGVEVRSYHIGEGSTGLWPFGGDYRIDKERTCAVSIPGFDYKFNFSNVEIISIFWRLTDDIQKTQQSVPFQPSLQTLFCTSTY